jgi:hypothetical protein
MEKLSRKTRIRIFKINRELKERRELFFLKRANTKILTKRQYLEKFGIEKVSGEYRVMRRDILDKAYSKAWENRNFEIDKSWTRAAYFWGFIVLIFGGYISIITSEHSAKAIDMKLDFYLLLLGFLFSLSWYLVIRGSKEWQKNWENHIDFLEDYVSGPIYKTIHYSGKRYYSVSKLNEVLALAVFIVWCGLLLQHLFDRYSFTLDVRLMDIRATIAVLVTLGLSCALRFGYCLGPYKLKRQGFLDRWNM